MASDAHVPGPGPRRPIPKKVATIHAHCVRAVELTCELVPLVVIVPWFRRSLVEVFEYLGIENGRADAITSASPFAEIDQAATIAAEREVLIRAQHDRLARWTTQADDFLFRHTSDDASD